MDDDYGRSGAEAPSGCEPTASASISVWSSQSRIPNAAKWLLLSDDNSERLEVSYDLASNWGDEVLICSNDSSDWQVRIESHDLRWLAARLLDAASAIEARTQDGE